MDQAELNTGMRIRLIRISRKLRLFDVAVAANVAPWILSAIESKNRPMRAREATAIFAALAITRDDLDRVRV